MFKKSDTPGDKTPKQDIKDQEPKAQPAAVIEASTVEKPATAATQAVKS